MYHLGCKRWSVCFEEAMNQGYVWSLNLLFFHEQMGKSLGERVAKPSSVDGFFYFDRSKGGYIEGT